MIILVDPENNEGTLSINSLACKCLVYFASTGVKATIVKHVLVISSYFRFYPLMDFQMAIFSLMKTFN